jgi:hypothetical protein
MSAQERALLEPAAEQAHTTISDYVRCRLNQKNSKKISDLRSSGFVH